MEKDVVLEDATIKELTCKLTAAYRYTAIDSHIKTLMHEINEIYDELSDTASLKDKAVLSNAFCNKLKELEFFINKMTDDLNAYVKDIKEIKNGNC